MSELGNSRHCWSWRSCFATVKYNKKKTKKQPICQTNLQKLSSNGHTHVKRLHTVDENSNILSDLSSDEYNHQLIPNAYITNNEILSSNENDLLDSDNIQQIDDDINSKIINPKSLTTVRSTQLDAIVEDLNEENSDELDETIQPVKLCSDSELINDSNDLYSRLSDFSRMNHVIIQFNDNSYLLGEFIRQIRKLKLKIDDIKRATTEIPRDAELLEARYSTLLATIESLSLLLKVSHVSSFRSLINHLIFSMEERMEQLNKLVQLSSTINLRQQRQDFNDDDFLSFRSALSSYEHLLTIS